MNIGTTFRGPINTAIFDWAGTVLDFGCIAPVKAFQEAFAHAGVDLTEAEARAPMGAAKREHIALILRDATVQARWQAVKAAPSAEADIDALYADFLKIDEVNCAKYSAMIPGALAVMAELRAAGIKIGSTTGYPRQVMEGLMPLAAAQGYVPDHCVTVTEAPRGRPYPDMVLMNALALGAQDLRGCVVVDDSPTGLISGRAAGMWAVGILASGNEVGLSLEAWSALSQTEQEARRAAAAPLLRAAGAHFILDTVADLPAVIQQINAKLAAGEMP